MKFFTFIILCLILIGCKAKNTQLISQKLELNSSTYCPDDGTCNIELIPNSSLSLKKGSLGELYATIEEGDKIVFKFTYNKNVPEELMDAKYTEEVYAELDADLSEINIKGKELNNVKFLYNRICYCKGQAGFYKISNGSLFLKKIDRKTFNIQFESKIDKVPQVVTRINETFILD